MLYGILIMVQSSLCLTAPESLEALCAAEPERVERLFAAMDLERDGLDTCRTASEAGDWPEACRALLDYYAAQDHPAWLRRELPTPGTEHFADADAILEGRITYDAVTAQVPRRLDGGLDWTYNGPDNDREWGWGLNRMGWAQTLLEAYFDTGNPDYAAAYDTHMADWVLANPYPGEKNRTPQWRGIETSKRISGAWPMGFYGLQETPLLRPVTRILMLSSVLDHAHYARHFHTDGGNIISMELTGLATAAVCWPEFKEADAWFAYALTRLTPELEAQVYPDGVQKELTSHYHEVTLRHFAHLVELGRRAGREVSPEFRGSIERMFNYLAYSMRPSGYGALNNDSDLDHNRPKVLEAAAEFDRPDWRYIATNGLEGRKPEDPPSVVFPWAGQAYLRSDWGRDAQWSYFEAGPLGVGHWHLDKLHLSVTAYGRDILVDGGRYTYNRGGPWRSHFRGSSCHNVVLVDGHGQEAWEPEARAPMAGNYRLRPEEDWVCATLDSGFEGLEGEAAHTRAVTYRRGAYWVVVDRIDTDRPRRIEALWHFHPACTVSVDGAAAFSTDADAGNVRITPASDFAWSARVVEGQTEPEIQGWWSSEYNIKEPSPCVVYTADIDGAAVFAWVLTPARGTPPKVDATLLEAREDAAVVRVTVDGKATETLSIALKPKE